MQCFPHIFEIAAARNKLAEYDLNGKHVPPQVHTLTTLSHEGWNVPLRDADDFLQKGVLANSMWELLRRF